MQPGNRITPDLFLISCVSCGYIVCVTSPNIYIPFSELFFFFFLFIRFCFVPMPCRTGSSIFFLITKQLTFSKECGGEEH